MTEVPLWIAIAVVLFAVFGAGLALIGSLGLLSLRSFYERAHPATLAATLGATCILLASMLYFSVGSGTFLPKAILLIIFIPLVNPVTTMLLARAALSRDRATIRSARARPGSADEDWRREAEELVKAQQEAAQREDSADDASQVAPPERAAAENEPSAEPDGGSRERG